LKLLVVYPYFVDTAAAGHSLMYETLAGLAAQGHEITVVSGESGYMQGSTTAVSDRAWYRRLVYREQVGPIRVLRTLSWRGHQKGLLGRLLSYAFLSALNPVAVLLAPRADAALLSPPPLYPIFTSLLACLVRRIPVVTEVRDIWPGSMVQMGLLRNRWLIAVTALMERFTYDRSRHIVALTEGIREDIVARGWPAARVHTLPCAVDAGQLAPDDGARQAMRTAQGWHGRFVLLYFGALGEANNLAVHLRAAQRLADDPRFLIVLVGDGFRREWLVGEVAVRGLRNVQVLPAAAKSQAAAFYNAADACVVTLQDIPVFAGAIPTKLVEAMACGRPVLCGVRGEAQRIVEDAGAGLCFAPDDDAAFAAHARRLLEQPEQAAGFGSRGRIYAQAHFAAERRQHRMAMLLQEAAARA
jgi:glycosyltransferase involved in cell wall biosynthesis